MKVRFVFEEAKPLSREASDMLSSKLCFDEWFQGAGEHLDEDLFEASRRALYYSDKNWNEQQIMIMVDIVADAYNRYFKANP